MNDSKAISDFYRMADNLDKPKLKISQQEQYWRDRADELAIKCKASMAVVKVGDHCQVWPVSKCGSNHDYIAEYTGGSND